MFAAKTSPSQIAIQSFVFYSVFCLASAGFGQTQSDALPALTPPAPTPSPTASYPLFAKLNPTAKPSPSKGSGTIKPPFRWPAKLSAPPATKLPPKKTTAPSSSKPKTNEGADSGEAKEKKPEKQSYYPMNWDVYRDQNPYPIDPRKPCHPCVEPVETRPHTKLALPGLKGRPYKERVLGACRCGSKRGVTKKPNYSPYWPSVLNAKFEEHFPNKAAKRAANYCKPRFNDIFNKFGTFKLIDYHRSDPNRDPYGCLGESKQFSRVAGVGFRQPGQPVDRGGFAFPQ